MLSETALERTMLYMVIERFKQQDALPVYRRYREHGRLAPEGVRYVASWVDVAFQCCFQLMETGDRDLLEQWISRWSDLVDFEIHPVLTSQEALEIITPRLRQ